MKELASAALRLKGVRRKGWVDRGVDDAESVADHSYALALLAWALAQARGVDAGRAAVLALIHDLAEADVGDETPFDAARAAGDFDRRAFDHAAPRDEARRAAKREREASAIDTLAEALPTLVGTELVALWREYADGASAEAQLVKELDAVETVLQARDYKSRNPDLPIGSFEHEVATRALDEDLRELLQRL